LHNSFDTTKPLPGAKTRFTSASELFKFDGFWFLRIAVAIELSIIHHVARLARLSVAESAVAAQAQKINDLLCMVEQLQQVDVAGVEPLFHPNDMQLLLRADVVTETDQREAFQALAPEVSSDLYLVPKVIENRSAGGEAT
jgi:aspartyl-tRNA(Asn)/glutamyl-tRNA(Gln) amidotransferase subunit C